MEMEWEFSFKKENKNNCRGACYLKLRSMIPQQDAERETGTLWCSSWNIVSKETGWIQLFEGEELSNVVSKVTDTEGNLDV